MRSSCSSILVATIIVTFVTISSFYFNNLIVVAVKQHVRADTKNIHINTVPTEKQTATTSLRKKIEPTKPKIVKKVRCVASTIWTYKEIVLCRKTTHAADQHERIIIKYDQQNEKQQKIKEMMLHAWNNYKLYAWGKNELSPVTKNYTMGIFGDHNFGATIVDALDTLYIMGLTKEFEDGRDWVAHNFTFENVDANISVFETNIRFVGGFLSCYALTGDDMFKEKAKNAADKLLPAFNTPTGIPFALINFKTGVGLNHNWTHGQSSILSEYGSMSLEFNYLSDVTGDPIYRTKVNKIQKVINNMIKPFGLYPNLFNATNGLWVLHKFSMGAFGDSFYEYLLKSWIQTGQQDDGSREVFDDAMEAILKYMTRKSKKGLTYITNKLYGSVDISMDHLTCFAGGLFALAAHTQKKTITEKYMEMAEEITRTCHESYVRSHTHLGPEIFYFGNEFEAITQNKSQTMYLLRPEVVESYFVMWRITHDPKYRDWGWDFAMALEKYCRVENGFSGIKNVYAEIMEYDDVQQSYFLAETLKYLYLLFSDDSLLPLDEWVLNTEAHPLPIKGKSSQYRPTKIPQPLN